MRILFALTYYRPHVSGLTDFAARLAEALAGRGHEMTVITSRHDERLRREEMLGGVRVVRVPVSFRVGKGPVMAGYARAARRLLTAQDIVAVHLPASPPESVVLPLLARAPLAAVYYCDLKLPGGLAARGVNALVSACNSAACARAHRVVSLTDDYAAHSPFLRRFREKCVAILPAVCIGRPAPERADDFRRRHAPGGERVIGVASRVAAEKGIEHLLEALPLVRQELGPVKILFTGEPGGALGEGAYWERLKPFLARERGAHAFVGTLGRAELPDFYAACDVLALPSTNSTEAFGLVQLEAMLCGTPVVASDLPGVRVPVRGTGMGRVVPPGDHHALAGAIIEVIRDRDSYLRPRAEVERRFSFARMVDEYEALFDSLAAAPRA